MRTITPPPASGRLPARADDADRLLTSVNRLSRRLRQQDPTVGDATISQQSALAVVGARGPLTLGELAAAEKVRPPTMTRIVARLEALGLVRREPDALDRRVCRLRITAAGERLLAESRVRRTAYLAHRLARISADQRRALLAALPALEALLEAE